MNQIRAGKFKTPKNRDILVNKNTPFYGYIVCDIPKKVADWLELEKNFTPMADGLGWFYPHDNLNLYYRGCELDQDPARRRDAEQDLLQQARDRVTVGRLV